MFSLGRTPPSERHLSSKANDTRGRSVDIWGEKLPSGGDSKCKGPGAGEPCLFEERQGGQPEAVKARGEPDRAGHRGQGAVSAFALSGVEPP